MLPQCGVRGKFPAAWLLQRQAHLLPCGQAAQDRARVAEALIEQILRRTGAAFLGRSGAVEQNGLVSGQFAHARRQLLQWDRNGAARVALVVELLAAHVDDDGVA